MPNDKSGAKGGKKAATSSASTSNLKGLPASKSIGSVSGGGKSLLTAKSASGLPQGSAPIGKGSERKSGDNRKVKCVVKSVAPQKSGKQKDGQEKRTSKAPGSPTSVIGTGTKSAIGAGAGSHVSVSTLTDMSVLGKVRVPTLIVNPADIPTTRTVSEQSWANVTIGGRRRPSAAEQQDQAIKRQKRTLRAVCIAAIVTVVFLLVALGVGLGLLLGLSKTTPSSATSGRQETATSAVT